MHIGRSPLGQDGDVARDLRLAEIYRLISAAFEEAVRLRHDFVGDVHFLLALLRPGQHGAATEALLNAGLSYATASEAGERAVAESEPPSEPDHSGGLCLNPAAHELVGRAGASP